MKKIILLLFLMTSIYVISQKAPNSHIEKKEAIVSYLPQMVAPNIISTAAFEGHASITPSGKELYFAIYSNDHSYCTIAYAIKKGEHWSTPQIAPFSGNYSDGSPSLSPDGNKLFFSSNRPIKGTTINTNADLWFVERTNEHSNWSEPKRLPDGINSSYTEFSPTVDHQGNLHFCSNRPNGYGDMDIYYATFSNHQYQTPILLPKTINSKYHEGNVGVSPDGTILFMMIQHKPGDYGYDDIHYSIKRHGLWTPSKNIGPIVNTATYDFSPKISPNGKTLFFSSRIHNGFIKTDTIYTYQSFQHRLDSPLNGFGNIYQIALENLPIETEK
ncbi:hypothetical protein ABW636_02765 [Aquimarina sp. 2201CG1-2-11]|uniref:hypothetical protein n=1 Tax=Aquimarina discodermiae TaxID=3231043 RepID=UPI0034621936